MEMNDYKPSILRIHLNWSHSWRLKPHISIVRNKVPWEEEQLLTHVHLRAHNTGTSLSYPLFIFFSCYGPPVTPLMITANFALCPHLLLLFPLLCPAHMLFLAVPYSRPLLPHTFTPVFLWPERFPSGVHGVAASLPWVFVQKSPSQGFVLHRYVKMQQLPRTKYPLCCSIFIYCPYHHWTCSLFCLLYIFSQPECP